MVTQETVVVTISRQLGSGGSYLAQHLARSLGFQYLDREILQRAAAEMGADPLEIEHLDEHPEPLLDKLLQSIVPCALEAYMPAPIHCPDNREVFAAESQIIRQAARLGNVVILGRGGFHILAGEPGNISIFIHAPTRFRVARVMECYHIENEKEAQSMIEQSDRERTRLVRSIAGVEWNDLRNYHLSIDTSVAGLETAEEILYLFVRNSATFRRLYHAQGVNGLPLGERGPMKKDER